MQPGTRWGALAAGIAIVALLVGAASYYGSPAPRGANSGPPGATGVPGRNGTDGTNGTNGQNGTPGANGARGGIGAPGTNGSAGPPGANGTSWREVWYGLAPVFTATGALTYLNISYGGCVALGEGEYACSVNLTNICGPEPAGVHPFWACKSWYYALTNVSWEANGSVWYMGSDPSLGLALGWGQSVTYQLVFAVGVYAEYPSGQIAPPAPTLTPTIQLGFGKVAA